MWLKMQDKILNQSKNTDAHDLAERFRARRYETCSLEQSIASAFDIPSYSGRDEMYSLIADKIEEIAKPDGLAYPLDMDGIPIKLGEEVYFGCEKYTVVGMNFYLSGNVFINIENKDQAAAPFPWRLSHSIADAL